MALSSLADLETEKVKVRVVRDALRCLLATGPRETTCPSTQMRPPQAVRARKPLDRARPRCPPPLPRADETPDRWCGRGKL